MSEYSTDRTKERLLKLSISNGEVLWTKYFLQLLKRGATSEEVKALAWKSRLKSIALVEMAGGVSDETLKEVDKIFKRKDLDTFDNDIPF